MWLGRKYRWIFESQWLIKQQVWKWIRFKVSTNTSEQAKAATNLSTGSQCTFSNPWLWIRLQAPFSRLKPMCCVHVRKAEQPRAKLAWAESGAEAVVSKRAKVALDLIQVPFSCEKSPTSKHAVSSEHRHRLNLAAVVPRFGWGCRPRKSFLTIGDGNGNKRTFTGLGLESSLWWHNACNTSWVPGKTAQWYSGH